MNQASNKLSDKVTVLVFKDNYAARTFQISLSWINRLGLLLGCLVSLTLVTGFLAIKYYRINHLSTSSQSLEFDSTQVPAPTLSSFPKGLLTPTVNPKLTSPSDTQNQKIEAITSSPAAVYSTAPVATHNSQNIFQFSAFPDSNLGLIPSSSDLPFTIQTPKLIWKNKALLVRFALQYIKGDQDSQQGRIVILARSPSSLLAYPTGVLNLPGKSTLIAPENGEFFSVSRFREVKADSNPEDTISSVEIFIFDASGKILVYQALTLPSPKKRSEEPPTESAE